MNVTFRQLRVFVEIARQGGVGRAAERLHLTPPAVSQQLKAIERELDQVLFDRAGRRMALTAAGEHFFVHARRLLAGLRDAEDAMERFGRLESGQLTIAMVGAATYFLPQLLARFHADHPAVDVRLQLGGRDEIDEMLADGEVDLCVMGRPPRKVPIVSQPFAAHPHVLVVSPTHRLARAEHVPASALAVEPFIAREPGSGTRAALHEYLDRFRLQPHVTMEMASNEAIKQAVMAGMGVSLVSRHIIALECRCGLIAAPPVEGLPLARRWHVVHAASKQLSPAAEAFRDFIVEEGEAYLMSMIAEPP